MPPDPGRWDGGMKTRTNVTTDLTGKAALVTGGGRGIGAEFAVDGGHAA
ncbi:hypothetical protein GCM10009535_03000 [Streptomyces thermocarboxydovorans]|uniref:Uncharacterized protein n=1 Tax=Streptomyces thermocarboxydovorans TaxID=59298 RepID=A0ABN1H8H6_9ACTN